jgi:hypothetical protein
MMRPVPDLIDGLVDDLAPVGANALTRRTGLALVAGGMLVLAAVVFGLRLRADLDTAVATGAFWLKLGYTAALAVLAVVAMLAVARPDTSRWPLRRFALPVVALAALVIAELAVQPRSVWPQLFWGSSWRECPVLITMLAVPILGALLVVFRSFAPMRPGRAGAIIGLASGALAAAIYSLHCPEAAVTFLFVWYSLGMVIPMLAGAALGSRLLRW